MRDKSMIIIIPSMSLPSNDMSNMVSGKIVSSSIYLMDENSDDTDILYTKNPLN
ncbi:13639_t:CDS:2 [Rhizophagus irregularis]|nr:13639_t:CDS:2 [Rhizophagus irregularis]